MENENPVYGTEGVTFFDKVQLWNGDKRTHLLTKASNIATWMRRNDEATATDMVYKLAGIRLAL